MLICCIIANTIYLLGTVLCYTGSMHKENISTFLGYNKEKIVSWLKHAGIVAVGLIGLATLF